MTVKEFYLWALKNNVEDTEIKIQHRDDKTYYCDYDNVKCPYIEEVDNKRVVTL